MKIYFKNYPKSATAFSLIAFILVSVFSCKKSAQTTSKNIINSNFINSKNSYPSYEPGSLANGLIAYYPMDNSANDFSGNGNNGTANNVTSVADRFGNPNSAYYFNGTNSYIAIPDAAPLRLNNTDFSLSAWVKLDSYWNGSGNSDILCKRVPGTPNSGWGMSVGSNNIFYGPGGGSTNAQGFTTINTGQWYMVTCTYQYSTKTLSLYVNNTLINTTSNIATPSNAYSSALLYIGSDDQVPGNVGYFFHGAMDDIRIYNRVITSLEIAQLYNITTAPTAGLLAYWPLNNTPNDLSGNGYNAIAGGVVPTVDRFGNYLGAYLFEGISTSYLEVYDAVPLRLNNTDFTLNAWEKISSYPPEVSGNIFCKRVPGTINSGWGLSISTDYVFFGAGGNGSNAYVLTNINPNQWCMVTCVYVNASQTISFYINGTFIGSMTGVLSPNGTTNPPLYIGGGGYAFPGPLNDLRIYTRALNTTDISNLYNALN